MKQKRSAEFKSKVAFEALKENHTLNEIGSEFKVHPLQVGKWKKQLQEEAKEFFADKRVKKRKDPQEIYRRAASEPDWTIDHGERMA